MRWWCASLSLVRGVCRLVTRSVRFLAVGVRQDQPSGRGVVDLPAHRPAAQKRGLWIEADASSDRLAQEQPLLAALADASIAGVLAMGHKAMGWCTPMRASGHCRKANDAWIAALWVGAPPCEGKSHPSAH